MKRRRRVLIVVFAAIAALAAVFFIYVSDYYHADSAAVAAFSTETGITEDGNLIVLRPDKPGDTALIFYPGGKVDPLAYIPFLSKLKERGITCVLVKMPFNLAVLDTNAADGVYGKLPGVRNWYIGGHSLGGAMASSYAAKNMDKVRGAVLLGAYLYGDISPEDVLTVYGSNDLVLDRSKIDYEINVVVIEGGNHAQFGNYGVQSGDGEAVISAEQQQEIAAGAIIDFMESKE